MKRVLIVDDDRRVRRTLELMIERMGLESVPVGSAVEAIEQLARTHFDLVLTDLKMPGKSGIELLEEIRAVDTKLPVILITAYGTIQTAVEAMLKGASDYVLKPFDNEGLKHTIHKALEIERVRAENTFLRQQVGAAWGPEEMLALPSMGEVASFIEKVAPTASPVLITGETGSGKEVAARCIHVRSPRRERLFVPLNCAALPAELLEAELFGHARGAFTGAQADRQGKFEVASGGTLFLDEIGDMPLPLQAKLLRVLEEGVIEPLGSNKRVDVDVRILSATNQRLDEAIAEKRFRSDLYYRLNTFELCLPPLRERKADIDILAPRFLARFAGEIGKAGSELSGAALDLLRSYDWPGNVRELRNVMERAAVLAPASIVSDVFLDSVMGGRNAVRDGAMAQPAQEEEGGGLPLAHAVERYERRLILRALDATGDNKAEAARRLGISERNLWYKLKKYGL
jgi:two-component system response regulator AtoC